MKILLIGEYSSLHNNLAKVLIEKGHKVVLANDGDGFKNLNRDINFQPNYSNKYLKLVSRIKKEFEFCINAKGFDIVQIISPLAISRFGPSVYLYKKLKKNNDRFFLLAAGEDAYTWKAYRKNLYKYSVHKGFLEDEGSSKSIWENKHVQTINDFVLNISNKVITCATEYHLAYQELGSKVKYIPFPILKSKEKINKIIDFNSPLKVLHGVQSKRTGFKGNSYFRNAIERFIKQYPNIIDYKEVSDLPYEKYKQLLFETDILLDQVNSYSPAINALEAMSYGKVVLGGCEREFMKLNNITSEPLVNVEPNVEQIIERLVKLTSDGNYLSQISQNAYSYVQKNHNAEDIACEYLKVWQS